MQVFFLTLSCIFFGVSGQTTDNTVSRWSKVPDVGLRFMPRDSHQVVVFNNEMYLVGGHTEEYFSKRLIETNARSDVWKSTDGSTWELQAAEAPFPARYGHTLTVFTPDGSSSPMMVLAGGFAPLVSNDIWISYDGEEWVQTEESAPWPPRAWHCAAVFNNRLYIMGGSPFLSETLDIWYTSTGDTGDWVNTGPAPWGHRAAHSCVTHNTLELYTNNDTVPAKVVVSKLYVIGGWDGSSLSDVWALDASSSWTKLTEVAGWKPRGWSSVISFNSYSHYDVTLGPRIWLFGGATIGNGVRTMLGLTDAWFSRDGVKWSRASSDALGVSSAEWCNVYIKGELTCLGKWGAAVVSSPRDAATLPPVFVCNETCRSVDLVSNLSSQIIPTVGGNEPGSPYAGSIQEPDGTFTFKTIYPDQCGLCRSNSRRYSRGTQVPTMYYIAGNSPEAFKTQDVFRSDSGLLCELDGVICGNRGTCSDAGGCLCDPGSAGEFCLQDGEFVQEESSLTCFPGHALVTTQLADGTESSVNIDQVSVGDSVLTVLEDGSTAFSAVYYIPHIEDDLVHHPYMKVQIRQSSANNASHENEFFSSSILELTADHIVYVRRHNDDANDGARITADMLLGIPAKKLELGTEVALFDNQKMKWAQVQKIEEVYYPGAYTVYTMNGRVLVNNVLCSNFGAFYPSSFSGPVDAPLDALPFWYFGSHRFLYRLLPYKLTADILLSFNTEFVIPWLKILFL